MVWIVTFCSATKTNIKIIPGVWAFGPAFKEHQEEKNEQARQVSVHLVLRMILIRSRKALETGHLSKSEQMETLRHAEAVASQSAATESTLKPASSNSWWNMSLWSTGSDTSGNTAKSSEPNTKG
jgi:hypothetical protein